MRALIFTQFFLGLNRHNCVRRDYNFSITPPSRQMHGVARVESRANRVAAFAIEEVFAPIFFVLICRELLRHSGFPNAQGCLWRDLKFPWADRPGAPPEFRSSCPHRPG